MSKTPMLKNTERVSIYCCGYCNEIINEEKITKHLKKIHNVDRPQVTSIITKVVML